MIHRHSYSHRAIPSILTAALLLLCAATLLLCLRSLRWADLIGWNIGQRQGYVKSVAGSVELGWYYVPGQSSSGFYTAPGRTLAYDNYLRVEASEGWWRREWFTFGHRPVISADVPGTTFFIAIVPHWSITLLSAAVALPSARKVFRDLLTRRRAARGLCSSCGYDLRGTPDRCPECGALTVH